MIALSDVFVGIAVILLLQETPQREKGTYTLFQNGRHFSILLFACKLALFASFLRWLNTVFDTYASFTVVSKTLDPLVAKNGSKQVNNNTNFDFPLVKLTYMPLPWQHE